MGGEFQSKQLNICVKDPDRDKNRVKEKKKTIHMESQPVLSLLRSYPYY